MSDASAAEVARLLEGIEQVAVCVPDNAGRLLGKRVPAARWPELLAEGLPMPNFHLVTDVDGKPREGFAVTGLHTGFRNGVLRPEPGTLRRTPWEPGAALVLCDPFHAGGEPAEEAPRTILRRQVERLARLGLRARCAAELEFYLYRTSYREAHAGGYRGLQPSYHRHSDNDILVSGYDEPFLAELRRALAGAGLEVETSQGEGGPGQHELNLPHADAVPMADRTVVFKHAVKAMAQRAGLAATFMAKVDPAEAGSGGHVHVSLLDRAGAPALGEDAEHLSELGRGFLAGLLAYAPELTLLHAPFANSYARLQPGSWAPTTLTWGGDNRTVLVRAIGRGRGFRFEFRLPGADANPYLSFAALLAAGIAGMERGLALPPPTDGNAYERAPRAIPGDLTEALRAFEASEVARDAFGGAVQRHLAWHATLERDEQRRAVGDWHFNRYFENA